MVKTLILQKDKSGVGLVQFWEPFLMKIPKENAAK
tara:strand:+ start:266 stop:370 length:105 start_codon:yes stop_codon:yes gene_type:complete